MSLLSDAKKVQVTRKAIRKFTAEDLELIEAWLNDEVTMIQIVKAKKFGSTNQFYGYCAMVAREIWRKNTR